ncbi:MAG: hypothetical protein WC604_03210 [Candidatus Gracilibacteria bacterium]
MMSYLLSGVPGSAFNYHYEMLGLAVLLILAAFALKSIYRNKVNNKDFVFKRMFKKTSNRLIYFSIGILFVILVRYENIPYFAMRLWMFLLLLGLLIFLGYQAYKYFKIYPVERDKFESQPKIENIKMKYLPNK